MAAVAAKGKFKPVHQVISEMSYRQREELTERIRKVFVNLDILDVVSLMAFLAGNLTVRDQVLQILLNYMRNELRMQIVDQV